VKVVIIGAGVGGLAAAVALTRSGHDVQVFERSEQLRTTGNGMIIWTNGTGILREIGIDPEELGMRMDLTQRFLQDGTKTFETDFRHLEKYYGLPIMLVSRGRLVERLASALPEGVLNLGAKAVGVREISAPGAAVTTFDDGTEVRADVVIGADGLGSVVRRTLHGSHPARYLGWAAWHGTTKAPIELVNQSKVQVFAGAAGSIALHPVGYGELFWAFETPLRPGQVLPAPSPEEDGSDVVATGSVTENLRARFGSWAEPIPSLLESISDEDVNLFPFVRHKIPRHWGRGRISLLGDAAHVVPPGTAQGVNQALEDAWMLSKQLSRTNDPAVALRRYCDARRSKMHALTASAWLLETKTGLQFLGFLYKYLKQGEPKALLRNARLYSNYLRKPRP
jgi:FAD-dependent urate hydroxylase